ncbi:MAG: hypothetical protein Q9207_007972 [Kuettlingeria erythrocarpa]
MVALTSAEAVRAYLDKHIQSIPQFSPFPLPAVNDVTTVKGGTTNFIYRLSFEHPYVVNTSEGSRSYRTAILKHATDYVASDPLTPFSVDRQYFEAEALQRIPDQLAKPVEPIYLPKLFYFDSETAILVIKDLCPSSLPKDAQRTQLSVQEWCLLHGKSAAEQSSVAADVGGKLGVFLAKLHSLSQTNKGSSSGQSNLRTVFDKNVASRNLTVETTFRGALTRLDEFSVELRPDQRLLVQETMQEMIRDWSSMQVTLIMGDF